MGKTQKKVEHRTISEMLVSWLLLACLPNYQQIKTADSCLLICPHIYVKQKGQSKQMYHVSDMFGYILMYLSLMAPK